MGKYTYIWQSPPNPPTIGHEIETAQRNRWDRDYLEYELDIPVSRDLSGPMELRLPPVRMRDFSKLKELLWDVRHAINQDYPIPYIDYYDEEQLGCHLHIRPFDPVRDPDIRYKWAKFAVIALNLIPLLKPLVCYFHDGSYIRCRNSVNRWASLRVSSIHLPRSRWWSNREDIEIFWGREYTAVTVSAHRTLEIRAFETITVNGYAFVDVVMTIHRKFRLLYGRRRLTDNLARYTKLDEPTKVKLVLMRRNTDEKIVIEEWCPMRFYEFIRDELWRYLDRKTREVLECNFEGQKISTFDDAARAGIL